MLISVPVQDHMFAATGGFDRAAFAGEVHDAAYTARLAVRSARDGDEVGADAHARAASSIAKAVLPQAAVYGGYVDIQLAIRLLDTGVGMEIRSATQQYQRAAHLLAGVAHGA